MGGGGNSRAGSEARAAPVGGEADGSGSGAGGAGGGGMGAEAAASGLSDGEQAFVRLRRQRAAAALTKLLGEPVTEEEARAPYTYIFTYSTMQHHTKQFNTRFLHKSIPFHDTHDLNTHACI